MKRRSCSFYLYAAAVGGALLINATSARAAEDLKYTCSQPPLQVTYEIAGGYYSGVVNAGNLFLQTDIPKAPLIRFPLAKAKKLYTLLMVDFDGNANGSWPEPVASGENSPVRHWIVGNIPGELLRQAGYNEAASDAAGKDGAGKDAASKDAAGKDTAGRGVSVVQPYRAPHIPMVSDRYGLYLFEQSKKLDFTPLTGSITNFDHRTFLNQYNLMKPVASNYFVAIYTSESPFSGKAFQGNDVSKTWHHDYGKGKLTE